MPADFLDAHDRHWADAECLFERQRWANADHLYGMTAECGLKRLMLVFGMPCDTASGSPRLRQDRVHTDGVWARYGSYLCGHGGSYALPSSNPFADWSVEQRYYPQYYFDDKRAAAHRNGAATVRQLVQRAKREGLIT